MTRSSPVSISSWPWAPSRGANDRLQPADAFFDPPSLSLARLDRAELLADYLGLSEAQIVNAVDRLAADGKYAMAAELIECAEAKFPASDSLKRGKRFVYLKLMEKNQNTDPFKFIIYSGKIGEQTPQINAEHPK
jgi:hypothetical protein